MEGCSEGLLKFAVSVFSALLFGFTASIMWSWFIVSRFHIAPLTIPTAIGISLTLSLFTSRYTDDAERIEHYWLKSTGFNIALCIITLVCGYIVHLFV